MICKDCNHILQTTDYIKGTYFYCDNCKFGAIEHKSHEQCCTKPNYKLVRHYHDESDFYSDSNDYSVWEQCSNCGSKKGKARKKTEYVKSQLDSSHQLLFQDIDKRKMEFNELAIRLENDKKGKQFDRKNQKRTNYINSDRWKQIRKEVLKRDNNVCQSCLTEEADDVHHTDYRFLENEPLFTLFSVCRRCHEIITQIQQQENTENTPLIKYRFDQSSS